MEILKQALRKTGLYFVVLGTAFLVLLAMFLFNVLSWYQNQSFTDRSWLLILPVVGLLVACAAFAYLSIGLPYLIPGKNSFLKIIEKNPQSITDIYAFALPVYAGVLTMNYSTPSRFFKILIKLAGSKDKRILLRPIFFKPVLNYIISVAPQAKVHN